MGRSGVGGERDGAGAQHHRARPEGSRCAVGCSGRVRREGGGASLLDGNGRDAARRSQRLVEPATLGDPVRPLLWVSKSLDKLASALSSPMGHSISPGKRAQAAHRARLLTAGPTGSPTKARHHPDRNAQFEPINAEVVAAQAAGHNPRFPWIRRRRSWSAITATAAATPGGRRAIPDA